MKYTALIVEDEPLVCGVYQNVLESLSRDNKIPLVTTEIAISFKDALFALAQFKKSKTPLDFCILDYRLAGQENETSTGLDLGKKVKELYPECKILMITSISDNYVIYSILEELRPAGFLIKSDIDLANFKRDIVAILEGRMVYSRKVKDFIKKKALTFKSLDDRDLRMIHLLDKGLTLPEIGSKMGLSLSGIEYRKRRIAQNLGATSSNVQELLEYVRNELKLI